MVVMRTAGSSPREITFSHLALAFGLGAATSLGVYAAYSRLKYAKRRSRLRGDVDRSLRNLAPNAGVAQQGDGAEDNDDDDDDGDILLSSASSSFRPGQTSSKESASGYLDRSGSGVSPGDDFSSQLSSRAGDFDESLIQEFLARNYAFFGDESVAKIRSKTVVIVGLGGVGSFVALFLLRSGVSRLRLIDFDLVTLSSLNRHAVATLADVGTPKAVACKRFFSKIAPWANVDARVELWNDTAQGRALLEGADYVVDAIDNIGTKVDLLAYCRLSSIPVFASMGAGAKCDPTRVQISDIAFTQEDPLARSVRRRLRSKGVHDGVPVVYSTEVPGPVKLLPLPDEEFQKGSVHELGAFDDFRVRILPVLGPMPAIFGLHAATYVLCDLAEKPIPHPLPSKGRLKLYTTLMRELIAREAKLANEPGNPKKLPIDENDIAFVFEDLHSARSVVPPHAVLPKPVLSRWDRRQPLSISNCVVLSPADVQRLDRSGGIGEEVALWGGNDSSDPATVPGEKVTAVFKRKQARAQERLERLGS